MTNVICSPGFWVRYRTVVRGCSALVPRGRLWIAEEVITVMAERAAALDLWVRSASRDYW